jgi:endonuclease YncB( thermonuclease family)
MRPTYVLASAMAALLVLAAPACAADADIGAAPVYKAPAYRAQRAPLATAPTSVEAVPVRTVCDEVVEGTYAFRAGHQPGGVDTYHVPTPELDRGPWRRPYVSPFKGYVTDYSAARPDPKPMPRLLCGRGAAVDGNTIRLGRQTFRLFGMEAPSVGETCPNQRGGRWDCGTAAKRELARRLSYALVVCESVDQEGDAIFSAHCEINGRDVGAAMVRDGFADAHYRDSPEYVQREGEAVRQSRGIWEAYGPSEATGPASVNPHGKRP